MWIEPRPAREVKSWRMREDFYYFVSAVTLQVPRCAAGSQRFFHRDELLAQYSKQFDRPKPVLCKETVGHLMEHTCRQFI